MDGLSDKLKTILSDPQAIERIAAVAKTLNLPQNEPNEHQHSQPETAVPAGNQQNDSTGGGFADDGIKRGISDFLNMPELKMLFGKGCKERNELLCALKPFVSNEKRVKLDNVVKTMKTLDTLYSAKDLLL
ncbi:MAG: hypothetical protein VB118_10970 [Oscillospiraceae bacterium]|nr:hypothetical protein [Oscillospiraceae bacterium]